MYMLILKCHVLTISGANIVLDGSGWVIVHVWVIHELKCVKSLFW